MPLCQHHGKSHVSAYHLLAKWTVLTSRPVFYDSELHLEVFSATQIPHVIPLIPRLPHCVMLFWR